MGGRERKAQPAEVDQALAGPGKDRGRHRPHRHDRETDFRCCRVERPGSAPEPTADEHATGEETP